MVASLVNRRGLFGSGGTSASSGLSGGGSPAATASLTAFFQSLSFASATAACFSHSLCRSGKSSPSLFSASRTGLATASTAGLLPAEGRPTQPTNRSGGSRQPGQGEDQSVFATMAPAAHRSAPAT